MRETEKRSSGGGSDKEPKKERRPFFDQRRHRSTGPLHGIHINIYSDPFQYRVPSQLQKYWHDSRARRHVLRMRAAATTLYHRTTPLQRALAATVFVGACVFLLAHTGFFSGRRKEDIHTAVRINSNEVDLLQDVYPVEGKAEVTAILLNWSRLENMKIIVDHLCQYDMFKQIMIWNNNGGVTLTEEVSQWTRAFERLFWRKGSGLQDRGFICQRL